MTGPLATRHMKPGRGLTVVGVDPSGHPLHDGIFHLPPPHTLDAQILETVQTNTVVWNWRAFTVMCDANLWQLVQLVEEETQMTLRWCLICLIRPIKVNLDSLEKLLRVCKLKQKILTHSHSLKHTNKQTHTLILFLSNRVNIDDVTWGFPIYTGVVWQVCFVFVYVSDIDYCMDTFQTKAQ